jgi:hypothetical protein
MTKVMVARPISRMVAGMAYSSCSGEQAQNEAIDARATPPGHEGFVNFRRK